MPFFEIIGRHELYPWGKGLLYLAMDVTRIGTSEGRGDVPWSAPAGLNRQYNVEEAPNRYMPTLPRRFVANMVLVLRWCRGRNTDWV